MTTPTKKRTKKGTPPDIVPGAKGKEDDATGSDPNLAASTNLPATNCRVQELIWLPADKIERHPSNWRSHPESQAAALRTMLDHVGFCSALIAYRRETGEIRLIDGHLRADQAGQENVPVLLLNVTDQEADQLLLTMDPIAGLAETNVRMLDELFQETQLNLPLAKLISELHHTGDLFAETTKKEREIEIKQQHLIHVTCTGEEQQQALYEELTAAGYPCRLSCL